MPIEENLTP